MTNADPLVFKLELARKMADRLRERVRSLIDSKTLKRSLEVRLSVQGREQIGAEIYLPQYWAVYYHDGHGPVTPVNGKFIVYFASIEDDPRVAGGKDYPVRAAQIRRLRLDPTEFRRLVDEGKLIVKRSTGPARPHRFFDRLAGKAPKAVEGLVRSDFRGHLRARLDDVLKLRETLRLRLL